MSLSSKEQEELLQVIEIIYGKDSQIRIYRNAFNVRTTYAVEAALETLVDCHDNLRMLVVQLVGGFSMITRGWLKDVLSKLARELKTRELEFDGIGCRSFVRANWKTKIITSTFR